MTSVTAALLLLRETDLMEEHMAAHAGERAQKTGTFHCRDCDATVRVKKGDRIPRCPCGGVYESRTHERGRRTANRGRKSRAKRARTTPRSKTTGRRKAA